MHVIAFLTAIVILLMKLCYGLRVESPPIGKLMSYGLGFWYCNGDFTVIFPSKAYMDGGRYSTTPIPLDKAYRANKG